MVLDGGRCRYDIVVNALGDGPPDEPGTEPGEQDNGHGHQRGQLRNVGVQVQGLATGLFLGVGKLDEVVRPAHGGSGKDRDKGNGRTAGGLATKEITIVDGLQGVACFVLSYD